MADRHGDRAGQGDKDQARHAKHQGALAVQRRTDNQGKTQTAHHNGVGQPDVIAADALVQLGFRLLVGARRTGSRTHRLLGRRRSGLCGRSGRAFRLRGRRCFGLHRFGRFRRFGRRDLGGGRLVRNRRLRNRRSGYFAAGKAHKALAGRRGLRHLGLERCLLHGKNCLLDLGAAGTLVCHLLRLLHHFFGNMRDDQGFGTFLTFAAVIPCRMIGQGAVPPFS